jgi:gamma-glutamyltranspeptidase
LFKPSGVFTTVGQDFQRRISGRFFPPLLIDPFQISAKSPAILAKEDPIYLTVLDKDRNCSTFIQSNSEGFGSQVVPGKVGFVIQNRGDSST